MSERLSKAPMSSVKPPPNKVKKSLAARSSDIVAPERWPSQPSNAPSQHFSLLTPKQIFAIPVDGASLPPPPDYLDCGNLQHIRSMDPSAPGSTSDTDMLISFLQSDVTQDQGHTWGDATELLRWLFGQLTKRLNHFLDLKVAELPKGEKPPMLLRQMKGVPKDMKALVSWSRKRTHRQELVDFRAFDEDVERWKLFDLSRELGIHDMVVLISEAKYRADFPGRGWVTLSNLKSVAPPGRRPLVRKKDAENNASISENQQKTGQAMHVSQGSALMQSEASLDNAPETFSPILSTRKRRKSRFQVFGDFPEPEKMFHQVSTSALDQMNEFELYSSPYEPIGQISTSNKRKKSARSTNFGSKRRKAHSDSESEPPLPSKARLPKDQAPLLAHEKQVHENVYGSFSSFESREF